MGFSKHGTGGASQRGFKWNLDEKVVLILTSLGLVVLLAVPFVTAHRADRYHTLIEDVYVRAGDQADDTLHLVRQARSIALLHYIGVDDESPKAPKYEDLAVQLKQTLADETIIRGCGDEALANWRNGSDALNKWMATYGRHFMATSREVGPPLNKEEIRQGNELLKLGADSIIKTRKIAADEQKEHRDLIIGLNNSELMVTVPLVAIGLVICFVTWRSFALLRVSKARLAIAVRETNHRVKNNLQVVAALLEMQQDESRDEKVRDAIGGIKQQVQGMAAVHELLSHQAEGNTVSVEELLRQVVGLSSRTVGLDISFESEEGSVSVKQATALALVTNELLLNSAKHGARSGKLKLQSENGNASLRMEDDGPGFPIGFDPEVHSNLGIGLVTTLVEHDLGGSVTFPTNGGTAVNIRFPLERPVAGTAS